MNGGSESSELGAMAIGVSGAKVVDDVGDGEVGGHARLHSAAKGFLQ